MKVTYWATSCLEPRIEAISKEIFDLAAKFSDGLIFSVSPHLSVKLSGRRCMGFHPSFDPLLRLIIPLIEHRTDINHIYSEVSPWIYFKTLGKKPIVLTIASEKGDLIPEFIDRCDVIVIQTEGMRERLKDCDVDSRKVRLIYPGINLSAFSRKQRPINFTRPKVLFATYPRTAEELEARGVFFLIEVANQYPEIEFHMVSRPWRSKGTGLSVVKEILDRKQLANVFVIEGIQKAMAELYNQYDFTVIPYLTIDGGKECPRSLIESLACGVPILISDVAPFSSFVAEYDCGCIFSLNPSNFAFALEAGLKKYKQISDKALQCAHFYFDLEKTYRQYDRIYSRLV